MTTFYMEVPAHIQHADQISSQVQIRGGTNWDLSRTAVPTPVTRVPDPVVIKVEVPIEPTASPYLYSHGLPPGAPQNTIKFRMNSVVIPLETQDEFKTLPEGIPVIVVGHADSKEKKAEALAEKRAEAVAKKLRKGGTEVFEVRSYGDTLPIDGKDSLAKDNRRVDIFIK